MTTYTKKVKAFKDKPDENEVFVSELKRAQDKNKQPKTTRYAAGKLPKWAEENETGSGDDQDELVIRKDREGRLPRDSNRSRRVEEVTVIGRSSGRAIVDAEVLEIGDEDESNAQQSSRKAPLSKQYRSQQDQSQKAPSVQKIDTSALEVPDAEDSADDSANERRDRARNRASNKKHPVEEEAPNEEEEAPAAEESSEYETDSEEDALLNPTRTLLKPVFVTKKERETIAARELLKQQELDIEEDKKKRLAERKVESRKMFIDQLAREEELKRKAGQGEEDEALPSDDDDKDASNAFDDWRIRELRRFKRDNDEREKWEKQEAEVERRRNMTDEELKADNLAKGEIKRREKGQYRFLQKYYHPGAFYTNTLDSDYKNRDFTEPTGADRTVDRSLLPKVLQVKKFGLKGRTKYTHLTDQDTSSSGPQGKERGDNPWAAAEAAGMGVGPRGKRLAGTADFNTKKRKT
jgi:microfibrillar-associated protein 1